MNSIRRFRRFTPIAFCSAFCLLTSHFALGQTTYTTNASGQVFVTTPLNAKPAISGGFLAAGEAIFSDLKGATNWAVAPYLSYGVDNHKVGGGVLALYDFNNYIGGGIGVDYLGTFSLVSGNVELKLPLKPLAFTGWAWGTNFVTTPFVYTGIGTPFGGSSGSSVSTHEGAGLNFDIAKFAGGEISVGGAIISRQGAGPVYSGKYLNGFLCWRKGF